MQKQKEHFELGHELFTFYSQAFQLMDDYFASVGGKRKFPSEFSELTLRLQERVNLQKVGAYKKKASEQDTALFALELRAVNIRIQRILNLSKRPRDKESVREHHYKSGAKAMAIAAASIKELLGDIPGIGKWPAEIFKEICEFIAD